MKKYLLIGLFTLVCNSFAYAQNTTDTAKNQQTAEQKEEEYRLHNDWANLSYYRDDNKKLGPNKNNRVLFMGDSITELWAEVDSSFFLANKNYVNRGISGQTTPQMLLRFRQDVLNLQPRVVVILGGTNDIAGNTGSATIEEIFGNLVSMMQLAQASHIKVIIASVLPVYDYWWKPGVKPAKKVIALNKKLRHYATIHHLVYVDYYAKMKDSHGGLSAGLTQDGVHPNKAGYKIMERLIEGLIKDKS